MANLRDIKRRITSVQSTEQITRTMEMVSSAKIHHATARVVAATPYSNAMEEMLGRLAGGASIQHPLLEVHEKTERALIVAVASDRGLAGAFNSSIFKRVDSMIADFQSKNMEVDLIACGKKTIGYLSYRGYEVLKSYRDLSADPTLDQAREIASICIDMYSSHKVDEVYMIYNHARNAADQDLVVEKLLPIQTEGIGADNNADDGAKDHSSDGASAPAAAQAQSAQSGAQAAQSEAGQSATAAAAGNGAAGEHKVTGSFEFEPDDSAVLTSLLPGYVNTVIYHGLIDSAAAEQGARRKAMKAATDNATEMIGSLKRLYNRARQSAITTEITEVVGGAAASED